jgi:hypothetical protein
LYTYDRLALLRKAPKSGKENPEQSKTKFIGIYIPSEFRSGYNVMEIKCRDKALSSNEKINSLARHLKLREFFTFLETKENQNKGDLKK